MMKWKNKFFELSEKVTLYRILRIALTMGVFVLFTFLPLQLYQIMQAVNRAQPPDVTLKDRQDDVNAEIVFGDEEDDESESGGTQVTKPQFDGPKININTASKSELMNLPNIGAKKAEEIIRERELNYFSSASDIMRVKGIGQKTFDTLSPMITV